MQTQQVDYSIFCVRRSDGDHLIADIAMAAIFADSRDAQRVALIAFGQRHNRFWHRRRKQQCPAALWRCVKNAFKLFTKAHVEHFVRFIKHSDFQRRQVKRTAFQMVTQTSGSADNNLCALTQITPLFRRIHAANAGRDPHASLLIQPHQFTTDLQSEFAGRCNNQCRRSAGKADEATVKNFRGHRKAKGHRLARTGLRRHDKVAANCFRGNNGVLNGGQRGVFTRGKRFIKKRGQIFKCHDAPPLR